MIKIHQRKAGFTLIELMVGILVTTLVIAGAWSFFSAFRNTDKKQTRWVKTTQNLEWNWGVIEKKFNPPIQDFYFQDSTLLFTDQSGAKHKLLVLSDQLKFNQFSMVQPEDSLQVELNFYAKDCELCPNDWNGDGMLSLEELDLNGDNIYEFKEVLNIKLGSLIIRKGSIKKYESWFATGF